MSFKLIAIRPLEGCAAQYRKVLKEGEIYQFYNDYQFEYDDISKPAEKREIIKIVPQNIIPDDFYKLKNKELTLNISAIVGMNGSGKSTLFELFYLGIYVLATEYEFLEINRSSLEEGEKNLTHEKEKKQPFPLSQKEETIIELLDKIKSELDSIHDDDFFYSPRMKILKEQIAQYDRKEENIGSHSYIDTLEKNLKYDKDELSKVIRGLKLEYYFEINGVFYQLKIEETNETLVKFKVINPLAKKGKRANRDLIFTELLELPIDLSKHFFYTIAVSYSHYGLNSINEGSWLNGLFHKNDSYQTPLVINPMRTDGNIDINKENKFVIQRLLSNLLEPVVADDSNNLRVLCSGRKAKTLKLKFNQSKFERYRDLHNLKKITNVESCVERILLAYNNTYTPDNFEPTLLSAYYYLCNKLIRICSTYDDYLGFIKGNEFVNIDNLIKKIIDDKTHSTFKFKQTMNFFKFKHIDHYYEPDKVIYVDIENLSQSIEKLIKEEEEKGRLKLTIEFLPPPIFDIQIILDDDSDFNAMSSGEKQKIFSISSIVYHLINLNSSFNRSKVNLKDDSESPYNYKNINILFDEVEQYFHPDLQKSFINDLLEYIERVNAIHLEHIKGLNILFATHSPFILSDIPHTNILLLENGNSKPSERATVGANILELLKNDFFLKDTFTGKWADKKLIEIVEILEKNKFTSSAKKEKLLNSIKLLGNPFFKHRLLEKYQNKYGTIQEN